MARRKSTTLTEAELEIMQIVWAQGTTTAELVRKQLANTPAESTVRTMLRILEEKGYLTHTVNGRTYVYQPKVEKEQASQAILSDVLTRVFGGSPALLVKSLLTSEQVSEKEINQIRQLIEEEEEEKNE